MKKQMLLALTCSLVLATVSNRAFADDELTATENSLNEDVKQPNFEAALKEKYSLTDEQLKTMHDKGMNNQQITIAAQLSKSSGKTIEEVTKMRTEDKMGWGKIAKELGVAPKEIGQSVASMRHEVNEKRAEKREERAAKRADRIQKREEKRAARREKKGKG